MDDQTYETYVKVQASTNNDIMTMDVSGGSSTWGSYRLDWTFSGGFTGQNGWTIPANPEHENLPAITIIPVDGNVEATDAAIKNALNGKNYYYVGYILNTFYCGTSIL